MRLPHDLPVGGTPVGGLSGIDRDRRTGRYLMISDDQSQRAPARFYEAEIDVDEAGVHGVRFTRVQYFHRPDAKVYPSRTQWATEQRRYAQADRNRLGTVDPEDLRVDPLTGNVVWAHEGLDLVTPGGEPMIIDPALRVSAPDGSFLRDLPTPAGQLIGDGQGPRANRALEGFTFAGGGNLIASVVEGPLEQDGAEPTRTHGALSRITLQDRDGTVVAQYAYPMDPLPDVTPEGPYGALTGISTILAVDPATFTRFLLIERAFVSGYGRRIRIYDADCADATDVAAVPSLVDEPVRPVRKTLVADLAQIGVADPDNFEGMTWGPELAGGERTLLLVSDNDFRAELSTRVLALALTERSARRAAPTSTPFAGSR
nr:esterase-like activity of phytase family protein [uncultured Actinoplanes sp.]